MTTSPRSIFWSASLCAAMLAGCQQERQQSERTLAPAPAAERRLAVTFVDGYREGFDLAARDGKPVMLFFTAEWCGFCHQMEQDAFLEPEVVAMADSFVCVRVDADLEAEACRQFQVRGFPTVQFLSPRGVPLNRLTGRKSGAQLVQEMHNALQSVAKRQKAGGTNRLQ